MSRQAPTRVATAFVAVAFVLVTVAVPAVPAGARTAGKRAQRCARPPTAPAARVPAAVRAWAGGDAVVGHGAIWTAQSVITNPAFREVDGSYVLGKFAWYLLPAVGETPAITGRRVDGAGTFRARANNAYSNGSWWAVSTLQLSTAGCWEITARYRQSRLTFRIPVRAGSAVGEVSTYPVDGLTDVALGYGSLWAPGNGVVHRIDPDTGRTIRDIPVKGSSDYRYVAIAGGRVWVTDSGTQRLTAIDPASNRVAATVETPGAPVDVAVARGTVWIAYTGDGEGLLPVDAGTAKAGRPIPLTPKSGVNRLGIAVVADGDEVWVGGPHVGLQDEPVPGLHVLDGEQPGQLVAASRDALWFTTDAAVVRVDPTTLQVVGAPIPIAQAEQVAVTGDAIWVLTNRNSTAGGKPGQVWQLDPVTAGVLGEPITVGTTPVRIRATARTVWVASFSDATITKVATATVAAS